MPKILVLYRQTDTDTARRLIDNLVARFGAENVLSETDSTPANANSRNEIKQKVESSSVMLVLIDPDWLNVHDAEGQRLLDDPGDPIRAAIEDKRRQGGLPVIPVLVKDAQFPVKADLPASIREILRPPKFTLHSDSRFDSEVYWLIERIIEESASSLPPSPTPIRWGIIATVCAIVFCAGALILSNNNSGLQGTAQNAQGSPGNGNGNGNQSGGSTGEGNGQGNGNGNANGGNRNSGQQGNGNQTGGSQTSGSAGSLSGGGQQASGNQTTGGSQTGGGQSSSGGQHGGQTSGGQTGGQSGGNFPGWDGSDLSILGTCENGVSSFVIANIGKAMTDVTTVELYRNEVDIETVTVPPIDSNKSYSFQREGAGTMVAVLYQRPGYPGVPTVSADGCLYNGAQTTPEAATSGGSTGNSNGNANGSATGGNERITICHVAGDPNDPDSYVTLTISRSAVYGPGGHFNENGTPQDGHENDYFGACNPPGSNSWDHSYLWVAGICEGDESVFTVTNGASAMQGRSSANLYRDGTLISTFDIPALDTNQSYTFQYRSVGKITVTVNQRPGYPGSDKASAEGCSLATPLSSPTSTVTNLPTTLPTAASSPASGIPTAISAPEVAEANKTIRDVSGPQIGNGRVRLFYEDPVLSSQISTYVELHLILDNYIITPTPFGPQTLVPAPTVPPLGTATPLVGQLTAMPLALRYESTPGATRVFARMRPELICSAGFTGCDERLTEIDFTGAQWRWTLTPQPGAVGKQNMMLHLWQVTLDEVTQTYTNAHSEWDWPFTIEIVSNRANAGGAGVTDNAGQNSLPGTAVTNNTDNLGAVIGAIVVIGIVVVSTRYFVSQRKGASSQITEAVVPPTRKPHIFISYRRSTSVGYAQIIHDRLAEKGAQVFLDLSDIHEGSFADYIQENIEKCDYFLVILAPGTLQSEWVVKEVRYALECKRVIIPVLLNGFDLYGNEVPDDLKTLQDQNAVTYSPEYLSGVIERLATFTGLLPKE